MTDHRGRMIHPIVAVAAIVLSLVALSTRMAAPLVGAAFALLSASVMGTQREAARRRAAERRLQEMQDGLDALLEGTDDGFFALNEMGRFTSANAKAEQIFGRPRADLIGRNLWELCPDAVGGVAYQNYHRVLQEGITARFETEDAAGRRYTALAYPAPDGIFVFFRDLPQRCEKEAEPERLRAIIEATSDLVCMNDIIGNVFYFNRAGRAMLKIDEGPETSAAHSREEFCQDDGAENGETANDRAEIRRLYDGIFPIGLEAGIWQGENRFVARDGSTIPVSQVVIAHKDGAGRIAYLSTIARDITERIEAEAQIAQQIRLVREQNEALEAAYARLEAMNVHLEALATTDGLTGLKNHRAFQEQVMDEFRRVQRYGLPLALMVLDVDHFKQYNDLFGHPAGDQVLQQVAQTLRSGVRAVDFVARYGGEEFVILLPQTEARPAMEVAERLRGEIESHPGHLRPITVSIGVASAGPRIDTAADLIDAADRALYASKRAGRNRVTHFNSLT